MNEYNNNGNRSSGQQRPAMQQANADKPQSKPNAKSRKKRPRWQRILIGIAKYVSIPLILIIAAAVGLWLGYVKLGDKPSADMFHMDTWKHIFDLIFAES